MKRLPILVIALLLSCPGYAQDFRHEFEVSLQMQDTLIQRVVLDAWEKANPTDAELFTSRFNYFFYKSGLEAQGATFNPATFEAGIAVIDQGIELYPDRLDMRFGKVYALGQIEAWDRFTDEIVRAVRYSVVNGNRWTWTDNQPLKDGESFFLSNLQDYQLNLYNTEADSLLPGMRTIASEVLALYPDHVESLSNLALTYLLTDDYAGAIAPLLRAEQIAPEDCVVLGNLAYAYRMSGQKGKAIEYYQKVARHGDEREAEIARLRIKELE